MDCCQRTGRSVPRLWQGFGCSENHSDFQTREDLVSAVPALELPYFQTSGSSRFRKQGEGLDFY